MKKVSSLVVLIWMAALAGECIAQAVAGKDSMGQKTFVFTPRGRRDPFTPPYGKVGIEPTVGIGGKPPGTPEEIQEAARTVRDMEQAFRDGNFPRFKTFSQKLRKLLEGRQWTDNRLMVHSRELKRRAKRLQHQVNVREDVAIFSSYVDSARELLASMRRKLSARDYDGIRSDYQKIIEYLSKVQADPADTAFANILEMRNKVHKEAAALFTKAGQEEIGRVLSRAESILGTMQRQLEAGNFDAVIAQYEELRMRLGLPIPQGQEALRTARDTLMDKAGDIKSQAEVGKIKLVLKEIEASVAKMDYDLRTGNYDELDQIHDTVMRKLGIVNTTVPVLLKRRDELKKKAVTLKRRGDIRREFVRPRIDGIAWTPTDPGALVNGKAVGQGDSIDENTKVMKINKDSIVFAYKGEEILVPMEGS